MRAALSALVLLALASPALSSSTVHPHQQPAKREYDSHTYYVVEVDQSQLVGSSLEEVAQVLGAEHVERVGALDNHFLVRAPKEFVTRGEASWVPHGGAQGVHRRAVGSVGAGKERLKVERDTVMERYALLKRGDVPALLGRRDSSSPLSSTSVAPSRLAIRSVQRQHPRMRVKRDLPVLPPTSRLDRLLRRDPQAPSPSKLSLITTYAKMFNILDPLWPKQWHLVNGLMPGNSINVTGVWQEGVLGKGVNVAIVDDGLDMHSEDLAANFHADGSWDYNDNTALPEPRLSDDQHGTRCAGEIAAAKNDVCGVGVAYEAGIAGIRILSASISDADEASALNYGYQTNDIYSCSWGPPDDGKSMEAPGPLIVQSMLAGVQQGRSGKGSIFVFASGNGGGVDDQCNFDGYTNSLMSITVGAIDRKNMHPFYSEACAANMVVTYSSGSGDNIHTTDVGKKACTDRHGGTSAAAPIAAGIFALVLEVRPDLTWRDMQHLCVQTAVQINPTDPDWQMTASGRNFNHKYGFGKLDAWAIVNAAKTYKLAKPQAWLESPTSISGSALTADGATATIEITADDLKNSNFELLEHVTVVVDIEHQRRGNVEVELLSPRGMKSILARPRRFDEDPNGIRGWKFMTVKHWDEDPVGTWTLRVRDRQSNGKVGTFHSWTMQLWGSAIDGENQPLWKVPSSSSDEPSSEDESTQDPTPTSDAAADPQATGDASAADGSDDGATKMFAKPTAHLPDDHAEAEGETHLPFGEPVETSAPQPIDDAVTEPTPSAAPVSNVEEDESDDVDDVDDAVYDEDAPGYLAGMGNILGSSTWMFVAGGTILVFIAGVTAFFVLRRRPGRLGRGGGYDFAPQTEEDGLPMLDRSRFNGGRNSGSARTRELYDAFRLDSDDEDESDNEGDGARRGGGGKVAYTDEGMASYVSDSAQAPLVVEKRTSAEEMRKAREEFSD